MDGAGSPGAVSVTLSRFDSKEGAYGFFTKRVVADGDPLQVAPQPLTAGAAGALGSGIAYVWRAQHVAELSYTNELESPDQLRASSSKALPPLAKAIGDKLPGDTTPPAAVPLLPQANQIKMGISFKLNDILGVSGTGSGAVGYYKEGDKRWRVFAILKADEDSAQDVIQTFKKLDGAKALKDTPFPVLRVPRQRDETSAPVEWLVVRKHNQVFGVGDEELVDTENKKAVLTEAEKLERLKPLVEGG